MVDQQPHMHHKLRVAAGAQAFKTIFKHAAADNICERDGTDKQKHPPPALAFKIDRDKQK